MKRVLLAVLAIALPMLGVSQLKGNEPQRLSVRQRATPGSPQYVPGEVIVALSEGSSQSAIEHAARDIGGVYVRKSLYGGTYLVQLSAGIDEDAAVQRLRGLPEIAFAERNGIMRSLLKPNDPSYSLQWNFRQINAERTWDIQKGDPSIVIAVVDTGIAYEDFGVFRKAPDWGTVTFATGFNVFTRDIHANDDNFHGTHVASTIAEATNNDLGVTGLCFSCGLMPVKVLNANGSGTFVGVAEGIDYAVNFTQGGSRPVKVINLSLGGDVESQSVRAAIDRAATAGIVVVAASGNESRSTVSFPASLPNVIAVGAVDPLKRKAPYSNGGTALDVVAPGGNLGDDPRFGLDVDGDGVEDGIWQQTINPFLPVPARYQNFFIVPVDGTSQATPHVAALAALLIRQGITEPAAVQKAIESTAEDLGPTGRDDDYGWGLIRPAEALKGLGVNR